MKLSGSCRRAQSRLDDLDSGSAGKPFAQTVRKPSIRLDQKRPSWLAEREEIRAPISNVGPGIDDTPQTGECPVRKEVEIGAHKELGRIQAKRQAAGARRQNAQLHKLVGDLRCADYAEWQKMSDPVLQAKDLSPISVLRPYCV